MSIIQTSLFDDDFSLDLDDKEKSSKILKKLKNPKKVKEVPLEKKLKSKDIPFSEKLILVEENVYKILGKFKDKITCIYNYDELKDYIDAAIKNGIISVDTETIGTRDDIEKPATDPFTCRIAGLCLYTPGKKAAYVPMNHVNYDTEERLTNQLNEAQVGEQLRRLKSLNCIFHNGKFDYMVSWFTCGVKLPISWDTMIAAQLLNENESAALKFQYHDKIDPEQEKYNIDKLFNVELIKYYPPELFALYSAPDALETFKLYEYQKEQFEKPENQRLYNLFKNIEMPVVTVVSDMQIRGVGIDVPFANRLSRKFHTKLDEVNRLINIEMSQYKDIISQWRLTPEANFHPVDHKTYKEQKSMAEQLSDPIELTSSTQLGIFFYDILKVLKVGKDKKKKVDEETLKTISDKLPLINLLLKKREYEKYLGTYIDAIPAVASPRDGRVHPKFNQLGREDKNVVTGRFSSTDPNFQNIPARGDITSVRCMFVPTIEYPEIKGEDNTFIVPIENEVLMADGSYQWSSYLKPGDVVEGNRKVTNINIESKQVIITLEGGVNE